MITSQILCKSIVLGLIPLAIAAKAYAQETPIDSTNPTPEENPPPVNGMESPAESDTSIPGFSVNYSGDQPIVTSTGVGDLASPSGSQPRKIPEPSSTLGILAVGFLARVLVKRKKPQF